MPALKNIRHEMMVQLKLQGHSQRQCYKEVYDNNMTDEQIDVEASNIFNEPKVVLRYEELVKELEDKAIMTAKQRMKWLSEVVKDIQKEEVKVKMPDGEEIVIGMKNADINTKIKAIDTLNKMDNAYQQNININGSINNPFENMSNEEIREILNELEDE